MPRRDIRLWPDPVLRQPCAPAQPGDLQTAALIENLFDTMYAAKGRGLAAPQIGVLQRVFVVDVTWKEGPRSPLAMINPIVLDTGGTSDTLDEQCLSIPDMPLPVTRPTHVQMRWLSPDGDTRTDTFDGILARCLLHELDHLDGRVIFDHQPADVRTNLKDSYVS